MQSERSYRLEEIKTQFRAREGYYRLMNSPDYSQRSQRALGFSAGGTTNGNSSTPSNEKTCIKISLVTVNDCSDNSIASSIRQSQIGKQTTTNRTHRRSKGANDKKICFNVGRELFVYNYDGVRAGPDASNPIYKRSFKGSSPTCHSFNQATATSGSINLLVGFSDGQIQLIDLNGSDDPEACEKFNVERLIDKTRVTCLKWLPSSPSLFLVAHASGHLYLYKDDLPSGPSAPTYQVYKQSKGVIIHTCKTKTTRNPIYRWTIGIQDNLNASGGSSNLASSSHSLHNAENESCSLNEFAFSPCAKYISCVSQDGFLRVFCYDTMELIGRSRSYYGGLSCVCWSPDGKYVVTGGEDDLITVWSFLDRRVVARGLGHKSWVSVVAFDSFYTGYDLKDTDIDDNDDDDDEDANEVDDIDMDEEEEEDEDEIVSYGQNRSNLIKSTNRSSNAYDQATRSQQVGSTNMQLTSYRFGSVGQDTQLCLWDLNDDLLKQSIAKPKINPLCGAMSSTNLSDSLGSLNHPPVANEGSGTEATDVADQNINTVKSDAHDSKIGESASVVSGGPQSSFKAGGFTKKFSLVKKKDKRSLSLRSPDKYSHNSKNNSNSLNSNSNKLVEDPTKLLGSPMCPRMNEVPLIEPSVCKKISFERLTSLIFCKGGFITSCQDGYVFSWARPSRTNVINTIAS